jgi:hypothetical protein
MTDLTEAVAAIRLAAAELNRAAWAMEKQVWPDKDTTELVKATLPVQAIEPKKITVAPTYPWDVSHVRVDWDTLRLVAANKLSSLLANGTYQRVAGNDRGYVWLGNQLGIANNIGHFLQTPGAVLTADVFIRLALWTGFGIEQFIETGEDEDADA